MSALIAILTIGSFLLYIFLYVRKVRRAPNYSPFTENFLREPGETLRNKLDELLEDLWSPMAFLIGFCASMPTALLFLTPPLNYLFAFLLVLLVVYQIRKIGTIMDRGMRVRLGMEGERATGQELSLLMRDGAWVFHDLPYSYGNIDHVIVAKGGVFAVETKAVSKPVANSTGRPDATVEYDGHAIKFPHKEDKSSLEQARRHAKYLHRHIKEKLGIHAVVTPVVALPGWFVKWTGRSDVWVINPKRGHFLKKEVTKEILSPGEVDRIAYHLESVARSVRPGSKKLDPNASEYYDFWNNPRYQPPSVD